MYPTLIPCLIHNPHCWEGACNRIPDGTWQDSWKGSRRIIFRRYYNKINHDDDSNDDRCFIFRRLYNST